MKYEARTHTRSNKSYGVWNNDMQAFQFIYDWGGTETINLETANKVCEELNAADMEEPIALENGDDDSLGSDYLYEDQPEDRLYE